MQLAFIGFGLIAGSIARAVRANPATSDWTMTAWSPSGEGPQEAAGEGILDSAATEPEASLEGADLVVLAAPVTACLEYIDHLAGPWSALLPEGAVVTDVASTKTLLLERANAAGVRFVGGHPMAGRETAGYESADATLFLDRPWVLVPGEHIVPTDVGRVADLVVACSAKVVLMDAAAHDRAVAGISHLPLVIAAALVESVAGEPAREPGDDWTAASLLAAGGWRDTTRVARGEPAMGAAIAVTNAAALAVRIRDFQAVLDAWLSELEQPGGPDEAAIAERLRAARAMLDES
jgi:prephenate dehydrogenase